MSTPPLSMSKHFDVLYIGQHFGGCNQILDIHNLKDKRFTLVHGFRRFSPWLKPWDRNIMQKGVVEPGFCQQAEHKGRGPERKRPGTRYGPQDHASNTPTCTQMHPEVCFTNFPKLFRLAKHNNCHRFIVIKYDIWLSLSNIMCLISQFTCS